METETSRPVSQLTAKKTEDKVVEESSVKQDEKPKKAEKQEKVQ